MRRTLAVLGVAATLAVGQAALAGPAAAKFNCAPQTNGLDCRGGEGYGGGAGGQGVHNSVDLDSGELFYSGGAGVGQNGGGSGGHCAGNVFTGLRCVGSTFAS